MNTHEPHANGGGPLTDATFSRQLSASRMSRAGRQHVPPPANPGEERGEPDLPRFAAEDERGLQSFSAKQQVLTDITLGCVRGSHTGAHVFGPPGVSKTHTILNTLREHGADWKLHQRVTAKPFYLGLEARPGAVHVVDDCEQLFAEKSALTLLRSALGGERVRGRRERRVCYSVSGAKARVMEHFFFGAIIFTSNRPLPGEKPEVQAVMSRIPSIGFTPTDQEVRALMRHVARRGHEGEGGSMSPRECVEVVEFVIGLAGELQCRLDLRWIEHGYAHYLTQAAGGDADWRDVVKFHMMGTLTHFDHGRPGDAARSAGGATPNPAEQVAIALEIASKAGLTAQERLSAWEKRTGQSRATYYRRLQSSKSDTAG